jgi:uncharacterized protein (TIGR00369 family)
LPGSDDAASTMSGLEMLRSWIAAGRRPPMAVTLDVSLVEVEHGRAVFTGTPGEMHYNPLGVVHGGYAATLLDSACGCAVHASLTSEQAYTTLELKVAFHRAMTTDTGPIRAEGRVLSIGRRVAFAEGRIVDTDGRLYASGTSTLLVFERKPAPAPS